MKRGVVDPASVRLSLGPEDCAAVWGVRGTGKSTYAKLAAARAMAAGQRIVVFDPHDEYSAAGRATSQVILGPLTDRVDLPDLLDAPEVLERDDLALAVVPGSMRRDALAADLRDLLELVSAEGDLLLVLEELGSYSSKAEEDLCHLATQSRHDGVPVLFVSQCAVQVPAEARRQLSQFVAFWQSDPLDLDAIERRVGRAEGRDFAARVGGLARGEFIHWEGSVREPKKGKAA